MPDPIYQFQGLHHDRIAARKELGDYDIDRIGEILDAASAGNCALLIALYREMLETHSLLQGCLDRRKAAVCCDAWHVAVNETAPPREQIAARFIRGKIASLPTWQAACDHLLDSILYPVAVVEKIFAPIPTTSGIVGYELRELVPVPHELLDFSQGHLRILAQAGNLAESVPPDPGRYIIHRAHSLSTPDNYGGPMRSLVIWWFLSLVNREGWSRALDRFGAPFTLGKYPGGMDEVRVALERAFSTTHTLHGVVIPTEADAELAEAKAENGRRKGRSEAPADFHKVAHAEIQKLILGHDGETYGQTETENALQRCDQRRLSNTFRSQLFPQMLHLANVPGPAPAFLEAAKIGEHTQAINEALSSLKKAGLRPSRDAMPGLSRRFGIPVEHDARPMHGRRTA